MNRVETREATTSRGAEGNGPVVAGARWSVVALVSEVGGNVGMATSCHVQTLGNMKGKHHDDLKRKQKNQKRNKQNHDGKQNKMNTQKRPLN